jgi:hypothetical protein
VIAEIGDLGVYSSHITLDCSNFIVTPGLIGWEPERTFLQAGDDDSAYLRRGVLTVLETARLTELATRRPSPREWSAISRSVNWGYIVSVLSTEGSETDQIRLAEWLGAGGRALVFGQGGATPSADGLAAVTRWFGLGSIAENDARRWQVPAKLAGSLTEVLPRFTSEAAERFGLGRRGVIGQGALADLVIWSAPSGLETPDLRDCRPRYVMIDGHLVDLSKPQKAGFGRFLGR